MSRKLARAVGGLVTTVVVVLLQQGCNASSAKGSDDIVALQAYEGSLRRQLRLLCSCDEDELCLEARFNDELDLCIHDALDDASAVQTLDCVRQAIDEETECLRSDPCDTDQRDDCAADFEDAADACPSLPSDIDDELDECPYLFECVDGGTIDRALLCDGLEDCDDGSDEIPC